MSPASVPPGRPSLFPRETTHWQAFELPAWRAGTLSVVRMGVLAGVPLHALRALALTQGPPPGDAGPLYLFVTFGLGAALLCGALTLHLANFPVRRWWWRVPAFVGVETAAELAVSVALVAAGREPLGTTGRAGWSDLPGMTLTALGVRLVALAGFALVLALVVQLVRATLGRRRGQLARALPVPPDDD